MTTTTTAVTVEEKHPSVKQLIELGRGKGYLLYDEIYEMLPDDLVSLTDELDEIYLRFTALGIEVIDRPERHQNREIAEPVGGDFDKAEGDSPPGFRQVQPQPFRQLEKINIPELRRIGLRLQGVPRGAYRCM